MIFLSFSSEVFNAFMQSVQSVELLAFLIVFAFMWIMWQNRFSATATIMVSVVLLLGIINFFNTKLITIAFYVLLAAVGVIIAMVLLTKFGRGASQ